MIYTMECLPGLHRDTQPEVRWPVESIGDTNSAQGPFGEHLVGVLGSARDYVQDLLDEINRHSSMEEIAHRVHEYHLGRTPCVRLGKCIRMKSHCEPRT